jgi:hypothetical protein
MMVVRMDAGLEYSKEVWLGHVKDLGLAERWGKK